MEDEDIIALYWARDERAIRETSLKYGRLCRSIAGNILASREDCEECVNDTYLALWRAIPDARPARFSAFVGKVARNTALKRCEYLSAAKRSPDALLALDELGDCVPDGKSLEDELEARRIERAISNFLWHQREDKRVIFVRRYWYFDSIASLSEKTGYSQGKIKNILYHMRLKLRAQLESEGIEL